MHISSRHKEFRGSLECAGDFDRLLVKDVPSAREAIPGFALEKPYPGEKPMILVNDVDDPDFIAGLLRKMYGELSEGKKRGAANSNRRFAALWAVFPPN